MEVASNTTSSNVCIIIFEILNESTAFFQEVYVYIHQVNACVGVLECLFYSSADGCLSCLRVNAPNLSPNWLSRHLINWRLLRGAREAKTKDEIERNEWNTVFLLHWWVKGWLLACLRRSRVTFTQVFVCVCAPSHFWPISLFGRSRWCQLVRASGRAGCGVRGGRPRRHHRDPLTWLRQGRAQETGHRFHWAPIRLPRSFRDSPPPEGKLYLIESVEHRGPTHSFLVGRKTCFWESDQIARTFFLNRLVLDPAYENSTAIKIDLRSKKEIGRWKRRKFSLPIFLFSKKKHSWLSYWVVLL